MVTDPSDGFDWKLLFEEKTQWSQETGVVADLRSDHAGEYGAVYIYEGAKAAMRLRPASFTAQAHQFVANHVATEKEHFAYFNRLMDQKQKSRLLPLWFISSYSLGFLPTFIAGEPALFATIEAVEAFVEIHYQEQIQPMQKADKYPELLKLLRHCCEEEVHHKEDARDRWIGSNPTAKRPWYARAWAMIVRKGSQAAVSICRRI